MLHVYLVAYDITDDKRLKRVFKTMKAYGEHLQYSLFRCELSAANVTMMKMALLPILKQDEDQVLIFRLGPVDGQYTVQVEALGVPYGEAPRGATVV